MPFLRDSGLGEATAVCEVDAIGEAFGLECTGAELDRVNSFDADGRCLFHAP